MAKPPIAIVSTDMAEPFINAVQEHQPDPAPVLIAAGLSPDALSNETRFISAQSWYDLAEAAAQQTKRPCLGYEIGATSALQSLPNMRVLELPHATLAELLTALIIDVGHISNLANYTLSTNGTIASLTTERIFVPRSEPAQIDGYFAGFMVRILRLCCRDRWNATDLTIGVCDPKAIPTEDLAGVSIVNAGLGGAWFRFPALWLLQRTDGTLRQLRLLGRCAKDNFLSSFRLMLDLHLDRQGLTLERFARLISQSPHSLKRSLAESGTTYQTELDARRAARAMFMLESSEVEISSIGERLGYPSQPSFSRAFHRWTGRSPSEHRRRSCVVFHESG